MSRLLWNQSLTATRDAKVKGKKQVRYHPIMIRFAMMIRSKLNRGTYDFVANVFNLPSSRLISSYDSVDGSSKDGVMFEVARVLGRRLADAMKTAKDDGKTDRQIEWMRMGSLSFDAMSIKNKVKYDPNSHELVSFAEGALKEDNLLREFDAIDASGYNERPALSQQFMVFIFTSWDVDTTEIKSVVARYSTGSGIRAEFLVPRIREIVTCLYVYGLVVNNICGDGATENRSTFKQLATMTVQDVFVPRCNGTAEESVCSTLLENLPNKNLLIAFHHPCDDKLKIFVGGEMPHWVKKIVNCLERSCDEKTKVKLRFRGQNMSLDMIKQAWLWDDEGFGSTRKTVLTEDHFYKNAYSRMRVHLAVQVVSESVAVLIDRYCKEMGAEITKKYASLKTIVLACDQLVDIWNANHSKKCECIDSPTHPHVKELHCILLLFAEWRSENDSKNEFITNESWEDLCWLVYGIEGVSMEYLSSDQKQRMMQRRGGSDVCEFEFAAFRQSNSNGSEYDIRGIEARRSAYRGHNVSSFSRLVKANSGREDRVDLISLSAKLLKKL